MGVRDVIDVFVNSRADVSGFNKAGRESAQLDTQQKGLIGRLNQSKGAMLGWGAAGVAAGVAVVGALKETADKFAETAGSVRDVARATGESAEEASRWVAIADDFGITGDQVASGFAKLGKNIASGTLDLAQYGAEVVRTKSGNVDMQATIESVADAYNNIHDPAMRSQLIMAAFGKSGRDLIPILEGGRKAIREMFAEVPEAQIFDDNEIRKAREYKLAMDDLNDSINEIALSLGGDLAPAIAEAAKEFGALIREGTETAKSIDPDIFSKIFDVTPFAQAGHAASAFGKIIDGDVLGGLEEFIAKGNPLGAMSTTFADIAGKGDLTARVMADLEQQQKKAAGGADEHSRAIVNLTGSLDDATASLDEFLGSQIGVPEAQLRLKEAEDKLNVALFTTGSLSTETADALLGYKESIVKVGEAHLAASGSTAGQIAGLEALRSTIAPDSPLRAFLDQYISKLRNEVPEEVSTRIRLISDEAQAALDAWLAGNRSHEITVKVGAQFTGDLAGALYTGGRP